MTQRRVLIIYFSHSGQTRKLIQALAKGLEKSSVEVNLLQLKTVEPIQFPLQSVLATFKLMVVTFFRKRFAIQPVERSLVDGHDLIVLAGPTWSYNVSGPILSFFNNYGEYLADCKVLPLISCRGYWRTHYWQLKYLLTKYKAHPLAPTVFLHPGAEPWRTIGVFLKLAGKKPEASPSWLARYYRKFGHTREQVEHAAEIGMALGKALQEAKLDGYREFAGVQKTGGISANLVKS
ncbi:MAG: NAD(P)H-dependent oxidoreductase [Desulfocapsaceae bacterium]|nr:NAD(P)H-dependent oxidoreductase [Desulfocapsaceae bacterium]